jgi:hypothetical protein
MRIRGSLARGLLVALILTLIPITAFPAQKITPGSTCKVLNQKVVYQNKTYTCIKSGKKLVWNKGVVVKKPTPSPTPTPTPTPSPTNPLTLDALDPYWTPIIAKKYVAEYKPSIEVTEPNIKIYVSKLISDSVLQKAKNDLSKIQRLFMRIAPKYSEALFYHAQDIEWAQQTVDVLVGEDMSNDSVPARCANAWERKNKSNIPVFTGSFCDNGGIGRWVPEVPHEYVHVVQDSLGYFWPQPCWISEGMANYYGMTVSEPNPEQVLGLLNQDLNGIITSITGSQTLRSFLSQNSADEIKRAMTLMEKPGSEDRLSACYMLGGWAWEALLAVYGQDKIVDYLQGFQNKSDWKLNFNSVFGITPDVFYGKLAPYFASKVKK